MMHRRDKKVVGVFVAFFVRFTRTPVSRHERVDLDDDSNGVYASHPPSFVLFALHSRYNLCHSLPVILSCSH
jgi:hypothetical protein